MRPLLLLVLALALGVVPASGTGSTAIVTYDAPTTTRVDSDQDQTALARSPRVRVLQVAFGTRAGLAAGTSTTPHARSVATEAAGGSLDSSVVYRYVSEGEANAAAKVGRVPNTDVLGQPRSVFYSPDYIDSVAEAEQSLQIGAMNPGGATASPGFRITASSQGAQWTYGGNVAGGSGIEMLTDQPLKVLRIDRLPR